MDKEIARKTLINYYMDNPDLGEDIDYKPDSVRIKHYTRIITKLKEEELLKELQDLDLEIPNSLVFIMT
jgi:hypothetical protein